MYSTKYPNLPIDQRSSLCHLHLRRMYMQFACSSLTTHTQIHQCIPLKSLATLVLSLQPLPFLLDTFDYLILTYSSIHYHRSAAV